ncbi:MAG: MotA/TolQ/ExbB proton channel family protein [Pseudomonadales bacterium]|jgi:biopolymer transport protein ExbB|nr:MotA/TolQ/ExbB proton channel family protein [Gammaproteobacteria bacterium]MBP6051476.1 MotA/TolQ/ExbB proton channel family protein [Pseudomonadales bacterium]MBK6582752.1 MotA/TolQ/ExbB proton channel family protein [Gammaproteobacteria bacterium]MBK7518881.1 MotA/TolQ/ExbB proton channel family protein [Gammaproteobacteria bacterium]MBK9665776.1 MotA/TolQ/ExbB proton channel family protein [Gammaproteobacteria bacterium]
MNKLNRFLATAFSTIAIGFGAVASAADQKPQTLDQLLQYVKQGQASDAREAREREARFAKDKTRQQAELNRVKAERNAAQGRSEQLETNFEANELLISQKQAQLRERLGSLSELFGHVTSASGDARATFETSMTGAQFGVERIGRIDRLIELASSGESLPSIEDLEGLWYELQQEMIESGRVVKFDATVIAPNGDQAVKPVVRVGVFNVLSDDGMYLEYLPTKHLLSELPRQPAGKFVDAAEELANATDGYHAFGIDPTGSSGGSFLAALIAAPTLEERAHQGGLVGYIIIALGVFGLLLAVYRLVVLMRMSSHVTRQLKSAKALSDNPLGRVLAVHEQNPDMDLETLELKLSEAVLKEIPKIESGLTLMKIIATVAPLLGLLGTVTGMIVTFQAITIFGAGDPKAMANGISQALVTTVLGLCVAIPVVLMHTLVSGRARRVMQVLEEQTTGIIAEHTESSLRKD